MDARVKPGDDGVWCFAGAHREVNVEVGRLFEFLAVLGQDVRITVKSTRERVGEMTVVVA